MDFKKLAAMLMGTIMAAMPLAGSALADYTLADFPAPFVVLRTLKGEIMVGLEPGQAEAIAAQDPTWLINGKRGIIQYVNKGQVDEG